MRAPNYQLSCARRDISIALLLVGMVSPGKAAAQSSADCADGRLTQWDLADDIHHVDYKVNIIGTTPEISTTDILRNVVAGADIWNDQAAARTFQFEGTTTLTDLPSTVASCNSQGIHNSLVVVDASNPKPSDLFGILAKYEGRCLDGATSYRQFIIKIWLRDTAGAPFLNTGDSLGGLFDLLSVATHEFGHALTFDDDPTTTFASIMGEPAITPNETRQREPYQYDINCAHDFSSPALASGVLLRQRSSAGTWTSSNTLTSGYSLIAGAGGGRWLNGNYQRVWIGTQGYAPHGLRFGLDDVTPGNQITQDFIPRHSISVWRDRDSTTSRVFFVSATQQDAASKDSDFVVKYANSSDGFLNISATGTLRRCTIIALNTFMACGGSADVVSSKPPSTAWAPGNFGASRPTGVTVTAWAKQDRDVVSADGTVLIAVSSTGSNTLNVADSAGVRSAVGPQVACRDFGSPRCIVAYVDRNYEYAPYQVRVRRFDVATGSLRYYASFLSGEVNVGSLTSSSRLALFYSTSEDKFVLVARSQSTYQYTVVLSSPDGAAWTQEADFPSAPSTGPIAPAYYVGSTNDVFYVQ